MRCQITQKAYLVPADLLGKNNDSINVKNKRDAAFEIITSGVGVTNNKNTATTVPAVQLTELESLQHFDGN